MSITDTAHWCKLVGLGVEDNTMTTQSNISHLQKDKDYIIKLMDQAKLKKKLPLSTSFSSLAIDCMTEYLEQLLDKK